MLVFGALIGLAAAVAARPVDFTREVGPILAAKCQGCHGAAQQLSGLRLDSRAAALTGGYSGPAIVPGKSGESKLILMATGAKKGVLMPPGGQPLSPAQVATLKAWIDEGAHWPDNGIASKALTRQAPAHWSFVPPRRPETPHVRTRAWVRNPVDAFILARLESEGVRPSPEADRPTLLRRASLDLIGLPATPAETAEFVSDNRPDAYERAIDRLLASPHYGERWARQWLDLGRYADSDGYEKDTVRPHAWRYRHWLIDALNRDLPFDQFTMETMAGDLLPGATVDQKIATGFHRNTLTNREGGTDPEQWRFEQVLDRTSTVSTVWLGLTSGCAQCHDHKYDPISQKDMYRMFAFFDNADETLIEAPLPGEAGPRMHALPAYQKARREILEKYKIAELQAAWEARLLEASANPGKSHEWDFALGVVRVLVDYADRMLRLGPSGRSEQENDLMTRHFLARYGDAVTKEKLAEQKIPDAVAELKKLDADLPVSSEAPVLISSPDNRKTHIRIRGDFRELGIEVTPGAFSFLHPLPEDPKPSRLTLGRWLTSPDNPLTARVAVNRMWQEFFGRGLVRTSEDFGKQGERPSHAELLDWLAVEFRERGWSMKQIHRTIVLSATYRQSSAVRPDLSSKDPSNILLARQSRLRLSAESIRDAALATSGLLNPAMGGRSVRPPQPDGVAALGYANSVKWEPSKGVDRYRRGLYIHFQRTTPYPQLMNFDSPDANLACSRRQRTNTPLQALNLLNDEVFFEAAQGLASRLMREATGVAGRIDYGFRLALGREPGARERDRLAAYFEQQTGIFRRDTPAAEAVYPMRVTGTDAAEAAAWVGVARTLLNLDEFITRE